MANRSRDRDAKSWVFRWEDRQTTEWDATHYIRRVPLSTIHRFTLLQFACLVVLWIVKGSPRLGILFPLFIVMLVPMRMLANRFFSARNLAILDAEEEPRDEEWG